MKTLHGWIFVGAWITVAATTVGGRNAGTVLADSGRQAAGNDRDGRGADCRGGLCRGGTAISRAADHGGRTAHRNRGDQGDGPADLRREKQGGQQILRQPESFGSQEYLIRFLPGNLVLLGTETAHSEPRHGRSNGRPDASAGHWSSTGKAVSSRFWAAASMTSTARWRRGSGCRPRTQDTRHYP